MSQLQLSIPNMYQFIPLLKQYPITISLKNISSIKNSLIFIHLLFTLHYQSPLITLHLQILNNLSILFKILLNQLKPSFCQQNIKFEQFLFFFIKTIKFDIFIIIRLKQSNQLRYLLMFLSNSVNYLNYFKTHWKPIFQIQTTRVCLISQYDKFI